jgi:hypothetical protein
MAGIAALGAAQAANNITKHKATPYIVGGIVLLAMGLTYFIVIRPVMASLGMVDSKQDKLEKDLLGLEVFDPNYGNPALVSITHQQAKNLASQVYEAINWYNDDEQMIYNAIQQAGTSHNLSLVSRMFSAAYQKSMVEYISSSLNAEEMQKVEIIIKNFKA